MKTDSAIPQPDVPAVGGLQHFRPWLIGLIGGNLLLVIAAELLIAFVSAPWGLILHILLFLGLALYRAITSVDLEQKLALTLLLAPLTRIIALAMPLGYLPAETWPILLSVPLLIAVVLVIKRLNLSRRDLGLIPGNLFVQLMIGACGLGIGVATLFFLQDSSLVQISTWTKLWMPVLVLIIGSAFLEEIIFRGLMQTTALPVMGRWALVYSALLFAALQIGQLSLPYILFAFGTGLLFAFIVHWSGSLLGVSLAHGIVSINLLVGTPYLDHDPAQSLASWITASGTLLTFIVFGILIHRVTAHNNKIQPDPDPAHSIRIQRRQSGLIYADLALKTGIPARQIAEIEYGLCQPQPEHVQRIAIALGITPDELYQSAHAEARPC